MANIHLIGGEKGGVGKSVVARLVAQYMIDKGVPFLGFDADASHGALTRFYSGYASPVAVDRYESLDTIVEATAKDPDRTILVDLAAQSHAPLVNWLEDCGLLETASELGVSLSYWHVMDSGKDAVDLLKKLLDQFGERLSYVLVLNQVRGNNFDILDRSGEKERALELRAKVISIKQLQDVAMRKIDDHSSSFWSATNSSTLGLMERQRVKRWLRHAYSELESLDLLAPSRLVAQVPSAPETYSQPSGSHRDSGANGQVAAGYLDNPERDLGLPSLPTCVRQFFPGSLV